MQLLWYRFLISLNEKYLRVITGSIKKRRRKRRKKENATFDFNDQIQRGKGKIIRHLIPSGPLTYYSSTLWSN